MSPVMRYTILTVPWIIRLIAVFFIALGIFKLFTGPVLGIMSIILGVVLYIISRRMVGGSKGLGFPRLVALGGVVLFFYGIYKLFAHEPLLGLFYMALGMVLYQVAREEAGGGGHGH